MAVLTKEPVSIMVDVADDGESPAMYPIHVYRHGGVLVARIPCVGAHAEGEDLQSVINASRSTLQQYITVFKKHGKEVPKPKNIG